MSFAKTNTLLPLLHVTKLCFCCRKWWLRLIRDGEKKGDGDDVDSQDGGDEEDITAEYVVGLRASVNVILSGCGSIGSTKERGRIRSSFERWLKKVEIGRDLKTCTELDVLSFLGSFWLPQLRERCRTVDRDGQPYPSFSSVEASIGLLSTEFKILGREGARNPCESWKMEIFRRSYRNEGLRRGVKEKQARAMTKDKLVKLGMRIRGHMRILSRWRYAEALRDLCIMTYLWESWQRGGEGLRLEDEEVDVETLVVQPGYTKTRRGSRRSVASLRPSEGDGSSFIELLQELKHCYRTLGVDLSSGPLFRGNGGKRGLSLSAFNRRLKHWLKKFELYEGESTHSFRVGGVREGIKQGWSLEQMLNQASWKNFETFIRYGYACQESPFKTVRSNKFLTEK
jgi:integrase